MALEVPIRRTLTITNGRVSLSNVADTVLPDHSKDFKKEIPANLTDARITFPIDVSEVNCMAILANKACTVKTNSTSSPVDTLSLIANKMLAWMTGDPTANKFLTADVTDFYVTTGAEATILTVLIGQDSTPVLA